MFPRTSKGSRVGERKSAPEPRGFGQLELTSSKLVAEDTARQHTLHFYGVICETDQLHPGTAPTGEAQGVVG